MQNTYRDLIEQTFNFPQEEFKLQQGDLTYHNLPLKDILEEHGAPLKISYLPLISKKIQFAKKLFQKSFKKNNYQGEYKYCYCTKSSHFNFVLDEVLKNNTHLETSSAFDIEIVKRLFKQGKITKQTYIICNGYKTDEYAQGIGELIDEGYENIVPIIDNLEEIDILDKVVNKPCKLGIRIAAEEEPNFEFYTSRLGIRYMDIVPYFKTKIKNNPKFSLFMLHFFINTGINDSAYYWSELQKSLKVYSDLSKITPDLKAFNIGGGMPVKNSLAFEYDYEYMINEIVMQIQQICDESDLPHPDIFSEFGKFTVADSGAIFFEVMQEKLQNDREMWYMVNSSFMTTLPDIYSINERFVLLPINKWDNPYQRVNLGGLSCDQYDYYNSEVHQNQLYLPRLNGFGKLILGFFGMGAYQDSLSGTGGIKHCLIPSPKHIIIRHDKEGNLTTEVFSEKQTADEMMHILGY